MSCIDLEKLNLDILDISRTITIPIRTPYSLTLKPNTECSSYSVSLYDAAQKNNYRMGGIVLDETASIICSISDDIICDTLKAYNITINDSKCGISQGSYHSIYIDSSVLTNCAIRTDVACCNNDTIIDRSTFKIDSSIDILNGMSIKDSTVIGNNFLVILANAAKPETVITNSTIKVSHYSFLDNINATQSNFNLNTAISYDSKFKDCSLNLELNTPFEPSGYLQPRESGSPISFSRHVDFIIGTSSYQDSMCDNYTYNENGLLTGCESFSLANSAMQKRLDQIRLERINILQQLPDFEENKFKQSVELLDNTTTMIQWVSGQPFRLAEEEPITIGQIFKECTFDNTRINTLNALILDECRIQNCSGIINANQILSRKFKLSPTLQNFPTIIDQFLFDEESNTYSTYRTTSYIGNSSLDFEKPNYGTTSLVSGAHIITEKWFGGVTIGPGCSITCDDFFSEYCDIKDAGRLILNSKNIMFKNLGIHTLSKEGILEIPDSTLYITPNYNSNNSSSIHHNTIPDLQGTITGTSISIHKPRYNSGGTKDIFKNATIYCNSLSINAYNDMYFNNITSLQEIEITSGTISIENLYADGSLIAKNCELTIANIDDFASFDFEATNCIFALLTGPYITNAKFNDSTLKAGSLDHPSLSGSIRNIAMSGSATSISNPIIEDHIVYAGGARSYLYGAIFPKPIYDDLSQLTSSSVIQFSHDYGSQPPIIGNCIVPSGNYVGSDRKLIIDNGESGISDIASMSFNEVEIRTGRTIFSHGTINKIFVPTPSILPDPASITVFIDSIELNNMNTSYSSPLIVSKPIYYLRDFIIKNNSRVDLDFNQNYFIYLNIENESILDGKSNGFSHCSFVFNVDNATVKNLDLNLHYSMMTHKGIFNNCTLNFEPLTSLEELNLYSSYREQLEQLNIPNYYYHMKQTSLQNCTISGTPGAHLRIDDCDFDNVEPHTPEEFIYSFTNNHFKKYSFNTQQHGSVFPTRSIVNLDKCYWNNINWSIDNTNITFTSMIDNTELVKPTIKILNNSRADFVSTANVGFISGDLTSNIALYDCQNLGTGKIYGQINAAQFINFNGGITYTNSAYLYNSSINNGTIYVTGIPSFLKAENFVNNNLIDISDSGNFIHTTNETDGNLIANSGTIILENSVNNGNIDCETLIMINSTNNGTINCQDLTWITSINNSTGVYYQNAISVDDSLTYPNS